MRVRVSLDFDILMQKTTTIGFIGAGNMAYALISGLINVQVYLASCVQ
jgi:hypothetical protein